MANDAKATRKLSADERIDLLIKLLERNGITIPKSLK